MAKIELRNEKKQDMIIAIKTYFQTERNEELGDLAATLILDFFTEKLANEFYNQGVYDSYRLMTEKIEDILEIQKY
ncbi:DUF2164 domain-containing protein [Tepidibacillus marianensis]|uniref:DUF2164 domain-containing protein n=1 Tax=Tepidibacillus marianensis TaxID=3131995 RepID=UPI0030CC97BB